MISLQMETEEDGRLVEEGRRRREGDEALKRMRTKGAPWLVAALGLLLIVLLVLFLLCAKGYLSFDREYSSIKNDKWPSPSPKSMMARFKKAAITCDNGICSELGRSVLISGGNAIDVAIAVLVCIGAINSHSSGIGGGFIMTIYRRSNDDCPIIDARETAPNATNEDTFRENPRDSFQGYKAIATPGSIYGLWTAYKQYGSGRIEWSQLLLPTAKLLVDGFPVSSMMASALKSDRDTFEQVNSLREEFTNPSTGKLYEEGEVMRRPVLADTLIRLANSTDPIQLFYKGDMARTIDQEMRQNGGFITMADMAAYRSRDYEQGLSKTKFSDRLVMCGPPPPSAFAITQLIISVLAKFYSNTNGEKLRSLLNDDQVYHRIIEAQKFAFAHRSQLSDAHFVPTANAVAMNMTTEEYTDSIVNKIKEKTLEKWEYGGDSEQARDTGTTHVNVVDADGNAVSATSSINYGFGAKRRSEKLGFIWNNEMNDFSITDQYKATGRNKVIPGKRPMSSMSPIIIYDQKSKQIKMVIGAAGSSKIPPAVAQVVFRVLFFNETIKEAIDAPRLHNQFSPIDTQYEKGFPESILESLRLRGHNMTVMRFPFSTVQAIARGDDGYLYANSDHRRAVYMYPTGL